MNGIRLIVLIVLLIACKQEEKMPLVSLELNQNDHINPFGKTIKTRFNAPLGFKREKLDTTSFAHYLRNFPLKSHGSKVFLYNGDLKNRQDVHAAVLNIDVGNRDLQQCADATMRLRAEYLLKEERFSDIHFNFTNGFEAKYSKWQKGYRISVKGNDVNWYKNGDNDPTNKNFGNYLTMVFSYAGTLSLEKEMKKIDIDTMQIGDLFIQGGSPGHAVIIVDIVKNTHGASFFMLAQSYMPAQDIHVLKNFQNRSDSPWYSTKELSQLITPEWKFSKENLRRFQ